MNAALALSGFASVAVQAADDPLRGPTTVLVLLALCVSALLLRYGLRKDV
jgi:hypothetical protein